MEGDYHCTDELLNRNVIIPPFKYFSFYPETSTAFASLF